MCVKNFCKAGMAAVIMFASANSFAQQMQQRTPAERAQRQTEWMQKNLALTEDQSKQVYNIIYKYASENNNARAGGYKGERKELQADKDAELRGVLTGNQFEQYQAHVAQMKEKRREMKQGGY